MSKIIPYINDLEIQSGAFVTLKNEIILVHGKHEKTAQEICRNRLSPSEKELFELWKKSKRKVSTLSEEDFLVLIALYDKIENVYKRRITTASPDPYERFFNYCIMDWEIVRQKPLIYNQEKHKFEQLHTGWEYINYEDVESKKEIDEIRENVPQQDRHLFFKK